MGANKPGLLIFEGRFPLGVQLESVACRRGNHAESARKSLRDANPFAEPATKHQMVDENDQPIPASELARHVAFLLASGMAVMQAQPDPPAPPEATKH